MVDVPVEIQSLFELDHVTQLLHPFALDPDKAWYVDLQNGRQALDRLVRG